MSGTGWKPRASKSSRRCANTNVDVPSLPEISGMFEDRSYSVIIDVGGDDLGAKAVSVQGTDSLEDIHYL